jgi:hypothetical protein
MDKPTKDFDGRDFIAARKPYFDNDDQESWWYLYGYMLGAGGYNEEATIPDSPKYRMRFEQGYEDGKGDAATTD